MKNVFFSVFRGVFHVERLLYVQQKKTNRFDGSGR